MLLPSETANFERTEPPALRSFAVLITREERYSTPEAQPRQQKIHINPPAAEGAEVPGHDAGGMGRLAFEQSAANSYSKSKDVLENVTKNEAALPAT